ncbi:MAG: hypothetical protein WCG26_02635 [Chloroflexales bacterium]
MPTALVVADPPSIGYRVRQFTAALRAQVSAEERALVAVTLTPTERRLFELMPLYDQRHCLDVQHTLVAAGHAEPLLLRAAMIHDCGKVNDRGRPLALGWYVIATLLKRLPGLYLALARPGSVFAPLAVYAEHAWRGARMAAAAGCPPPMVEAIRHYHDPAPSGLAALLKWADEQH